MPVPTESGMMIASFSFSRNAPDYGAISRRVELIEMDSRIAAVAK